MDPQLDSSKPTRKMTVEFETNSPSNENSNDLSQSTILSEDLKKATEHFSLKKVTVRRADSLIDNPFSVKEVAQELTARVVLDSQKVLFTFQVSLGLIELLIEPDICLETHSFEQTYLAKMVSILETYRNLQGYTKISEKRREIGAMHYILYLHLILADSTNLEGLVNLFKVSRQFPIQRKRAHQTNIMNAWSIIDSITEAKPSANIVKPEFLDFSILIVSDDINKFDIKTRELILHEPNIFHSLRDNGHMDLHFSCFVLTLIPTNQQPSLLSFMKNPERYSERYSQLFLSIIQEKKETYLADIGTVMEDQVDKLVNGSKSQPDIKDIRNLVMAGAQHPQLQKVLISMLGWESVTEETIKLLNAYYDRTNWQIRCQFSSTLTQVGKQFRVDYLIDKQNVKEQELVFQVMSPCLNPKSKGRYVLSWYRPVLQEYVSQDHSYLWCTLQLGKFTQTGLYDWKIMRMNASGRITSVYKILNMQDYKSSFDLSENMNKVRESKSVQGRFIVHPQNVRDIQLHEVYIDLKAQGRQLGNFKSVELDLNYYKQQNINTIYLSGILERDFGPIYSKGKLVNYQRANASAYGPLDRLSINSMAGGEPAFKALCLVAKQKGIKIIVDCLARVGSSRMSKKYKDLLMYNLDGQGKLNAFYGSEGKAMIPQDTVILNYRMKETWDQFLEEISELIQKFDLDGIQIDNGQSCPQTFKLDREELERKQTDGKPVYTNLEIIQGKVVLKDANCGYWSSNTAYANPFYIRLVKELWRRHPKLIMIADTWGSDILEYRDISLSSSGLIPRVYKLTLALNYLLGQNLHKDGRIAKIEAKNVNSLKKLQDQKQKFFPKGWIAIQSTTSCTWPYPAFMYRRASWVAVDLFFLMSDIPMTCLGEEQGQAFKNKQTTSMYVQRKGPRSGIKDTEDFVKMCKMDQGFFEYHCKLSIPNAFETVVYNSTVREPGQIPYLQESFVKEVGPEYGFNLKEIHKHYAHRRLLRSKYAALRYGKITGLQAQHQYGYHSLVLAFARSLGSQILLIAINFNPSPVEMLFNLKSLKYLFPNAEKSDVVIELKDIFNQENNIDNFYTIEDFLCNKLEYKIPGYKTILLQIQIHVGGDKLQWARKCSTKRLIKILNARPSKWVYSSTLTNRILQLIDSKISIKQFANHFLFLYENYILLNEIDFNQMISQTHQFWASKTKTNRLFGYLKKLQTQYHDVIPRHLGNAIDHLFRQNNLGPIVFVTPEIGQWSCVGGLAIMVDQLSKELAKIGQDVVVISPYYEINKKGKTDYLAADGFKYVKNIQLWSSNVRFQLGIHYGVQNGVKYIWLHNPELFSMPYKGQDPLYVTKQLVFFALGCLQALCQLKIYPSTLVTNDWFCGFVPGYVKVQRYGETFKGCKLVHIVHNLDPLYQGRLYPKLQNGDLNWLIQLPREWLMDSVPDKLVINPSRCALSACDNWGTVSYSYKVDLLQESPLADILRRYPNPFSFPNGVRRAERLHILQTKTPGNHMDAKRMIQTKYFKCSGLEKDIPVFSFVGRVTKQKGVHLILDVIERLLYENDSKIHFLIGGPSDAREEYGKYCAQRMVYLAAKYPNCVWASPTTFFEDGPLINIGSDFGMMPSLFQPGGIVQHEFFSGSTPVISFRTGGLKDTVIEYNYKTGKGNGFNFMNYDSEDFRNCIQRGLNYFKLPVHYDKLRQNALESVIDVEDVAKAWNNEFHRLHNKLFIQWNMVDFQAKSIQSEANIKVESSDALFQKESGNLWCQQDEIKKTLTKVLINAQILKDRPHDFVFQTEKLPRPRQVYICGSWDAWKQKKRLKYEPYSRNWKVVLSLQPGTYLYKYEVDDQWVCSNDQIDLDINGTPNNIVVIE